MLKISGNNVIGSTVHGKTTLEGANYQLGQKLETNSQLFGIAMNNGRLAEANRLRAVMLELQTDINRVYVAMLEQAVYEIPT